MSEQILIEISEDVLEVDLVSDVLSVEMAEVGPRGPSGDVSDMYYEASGPIGGHRVVSILPNGGIGYTDITDAASVAAVIGLTLGAAEDGAQTLVRYSGEVTSSSWSWIGSEPVFCGLDGVPTQTVPVSGAVLPIGVAIRSDAIVLRLGTPIFLV